MFLHQRFCFSSSDLSKQATYNEANILMIDRNLQKVLFNCQKYDYQKASSEILQEFQRLGISISSSKHDKNPLYFNIPDLHGSNVKDHVDSVSEELSHPYMKLLESFGSPPELPKIWEFSSGWTKYDGDKTYPVEAPQEDALIFDTEVLVKEGHVPTIAVALTSNGYSWSSRRLFCLDDSCINDINSFDYLIPIYGSKNKDISKCIIGHFVSYDRARISEEYLLDGTGLRFVDTLSLHVAVSGLTSTQRFLKTSADKHLFNNKAWQDFIGRRTDKQQLDTNPDTEAFIMDIDWLSETSLNSLSDVYRLYCKKEPPQDKQMRSIFESGSIEDVHTNFQELFKYCATDVLMTYEIMQVLWPIFKERFPHPASFYGLLEMSSMYLPINDNWIKFQQTAESAYTENISRQKTLLMQLANQALAKYSDNSNEEWYRDLMPKPVLKWGVLIPGRIPQPYGDPRYYVQSPSTDTNVSIESNEDSSSSSDLCHYNSEIRSIISVVKSSAAGNKTLDFPYGAYLNYWLTDVKRRLLADFQLDASTSSDDKFSDNLAVAYSHRIKPDIRDANLLDELQRSIGIMPVEREERIRLALTISAIRKLGEQKALINSKLQKTNNNNHNELIYEKLGELQAQGSSFWLNSNRFDQNPSKYSPRYQRRNTVRYAVDTVNPVIPTCWFKHLPHESGTGLPVGSPLSRSFQNHIASHRLHSADFNLATSSCTTPINSESTKSRPVMGLADQLLRDRVHVTFWQSYSKRIKSQMAIWLPHDQLPKTVLNDRLYNTKANYGAILPQVITSGTVSRRAVEPLWLTASNADENRLGSEIKAMVQSPPGYVFVGADVDSQEMWIAALIGDASVGFQGATPYGWMTLQGNKIDGTDLHTKIAKEMGIKRSESKILNYSRLYGSGIEFASHLLAKFCNLTPEQASLKAKQLFLLTKGRRTTTVDPSLNETSSSRWQGGSESAVFNQLESIARSPEPRTPFLNAKLTRALNPKLVKDDFLPSRVNWVVQSSAVDYLHCMLVLMRWLIKKFKIPARLCISIHDELRYICPKPHMYQVALALQISNLLTRAFFVYQLGMRDLPESVAFFSSVEVDTCIRKESKDDCITPSNSDGLQKGYGISPGQSITIQDILDKTGGSMEL
ncbi:DNA polymerase subunit gamma-1 [Schistosoma japonicum]|nr:DNA polymerase subunit gamma-1 [Schistosoma japonicum]